MVNLGFGFDNLGFLMIFTFSIDVCESFKFESTIVVFLVELVTDLVVIDLDRVIAPILNNNTRVFWKYIGNIVQQIT